MRALQGAGLSTTEYRFCFLLSGGDCHWFTYENGNVIRDVLLARPIGAQSLLAGRNQRTARVPYITIERRCVKTKHWHLALGWRRLRES